MATIGFNFTTNDFYYLVLDNRKQNPLFVTKGKVSLPKNYNTPEIVEWFETELTLLLNNNSPSSVSYKLTITRVTNQYVSNVYYGQAILNLLCRKKNINITHTSPSSLVPSKFNQPKGTDLLKFIDHILGSHPPHWDSKMKDAALIALNLLP